MSGRVARPVAACHSGRCLESRGLAMLLFALVAAGAAGPARADADKEGEGRYQVVIDRAPFGTVTGVAEKVPGFAERLMFVGLVPSATTNQPLAVLYDSSRNRSVLVAVGDSVGAPGDPANRPGDDIRVVKVDVQGENSSVTIQHGIDTARLTLKTRETPLPSAGAGPVPPMPMPAGAGAMTVPGQAPTPGGTGVLLPTRRRIPFRPREQ